MDDLVESILDYIRADYTDYAIMINGEWGSGKTYFWNHKIRNKIESMQVNGKKYTTIYGHLLKIKVSPGQAVDENTVIGLVGGETTALKNGGYDRCTTGAHLHYAITEEYHTYDFSSYTINPRVMNHYPVSFFEFFTR